jgi:DNA repair exonuclease SbcCD ATPase subunit
MHIQNIHLQNIMTHGNTEVTFPDQGITLVTGDNGAGKSGMVIESIATALWGKTLRKTPVWRTTEKGTILVEAKTDADVFKVIRSKTPKGSPKLELSKQATTTKAQENLESLVGEWDTWKKTSLFSSQDDTSQFAQATDAERKRLIEDLLGINKFDAALQRCREDLRSVESELASADKNEAVLEERTKSLTAQLKALEDQEDEEIDLDLEDEVLGLQKKRDKVSKMIRECSDSVRDLSKKIHSTEREMLEARGDINLAKKEYDRLNLDKCPTCGEKIKKKLKDKLAANVEDNKKVFEDLQKAWNQDISNWNTEIAELEEDKEALEPKYEKLTSELAGLRHQLKSQEEAIKRQKRKKTQLDELGKNLKIAESELDDVVNIGKELESKQRLLKTVEKVLGLQGVRAHIITRALKGIEAVANRWLGQIAKGVSIELNPYSEKKTGGVTDKIALKIHGVGGGYGYDGASAGERRRVDIALLCALAEIAAAARGVSQGDLFVDEVADGLDADGRAAVAEVFRELAKDKSVVVITHDADLAKLLQPVQHLHVTKNGKEAKVQVN